MKKPKGEGARRKGQAFAAMQARKGRKSGQARRKATEARDADIHRLRRLGYSMPEIASRKDIDKSTVSRVLKRIRQARDAFSTPTAGSSSTR